MKVVKIYFTYIMGAVNEKIYLGYMMPSNFSEIGYAIGMLTPSQIRAARALLGWKQSELASASGVSEVSIKNIERGATDARGSTLGKIEAALQAAGIVFIPEGDYQGGGGSGVRFK